METDQACVAPSAGQPLRPSWSGAWSPWPRLPGGGWDPRQRVRIPGPALLAVRHLNQPTAQPEHYDVQLVTRDGRHLSLGGTVLGGTHRTWGGQIPVKLTQVRQLRFQAASGQSTIVAYLNPRNPWSPG